jgi:hypothetical protein
MRRMASVLAAGMGIVLTSPALATNLPIGPGVRTTARKLSLPASINRHTMKPHEHKREIARRLRQKARP